MVRKPIFILKVLFMTTTLLYEFDDVCTMMRSICRAFVPDGYGIYKLTRNGKFAILVCKDGLPDCEPVGIDNQAHMDAFKHRILFGKPLVIHLPRFYAGVLTLCKGYLHDESPYMMEYKYGEFVDKLSAYLDMFLIHNELSPYANIIRRHGWTIPQSEVDNFIASIRSIHGIVSMTDIHPKVKWCHTGDEIEFFIISLDGFYHTGPNETKVYHEPGRCAVFMTGVLPSDVRDVIVNALTFKVDEPLHITPLSGFDL